MSGEKNQTFPPECRRAAPLMWDADACSGCDYELECYKRFDKYWHDWPKHEEKAEG